MYAKIVKYIYIYLYLYVNIYVWVLIYIFIYDKGRLWMNITTLIACWVLLMFFRLLWYCGCGKWSFRMCMFYCVVVDGGNELNVKVPTCEPVLRSTPVYTQPRSPFHTYVSTGCWYALLFWLWFRWLNSGPSGDSGISGTGNPGVPGIPFQN